MLNGSLLWTLKPELFSCLLFLKELKDISHGYWYCRLHTWGNSYSWRLLSHSKSHFI